MKKIKQWRSVNSCALIETIALDPFVVVATLDRHESEVSRDFFEEDVKKPSMRELSLIVPAISCSKVTFKLYGKGRITMGIIGAHK